MFKKRGQKAANVETTTKQQLDTKLCHIHNKFMQRDIQLVIVTEQPNFCPDYHIFSFKW